MNEKSRESAEIREELISQIVLGDDFDIILRNSNILKQYGCLTPADYKKVKRFIRNEMECSMIWPPNNELINT